MRERLNYAPDSHIFKGAPALLVHAQVADREEGNASGRLRRALIIGNHIQKLLESPVPDKIFAECVRISDEVSKSTCCISPSFLLLIIQKVHQKLDTRAQMLIQVLIVEASVAHSEESKLSSVSVRILTARNGSLNKSMLEQLLIEVASMSAQITNQVADFGPNTGIFMTDERVEFNIDIGVVDRLIELLRDPSQLGDQT